MAQGQLIIRLAEKLRTTEVDTNLIFGNDGAGGVAWIPVPSSPTAWGLITGTLSDQTDLQDALNLKATVVDLDAHVADVANPHVVTQAQVGLGNVDNTSDLNKPISTLTQQALDLKADTGAISVIGFSGNINDAIVAGANTIGNFIVRDGSASFVERPATSADIEGLGGLLDDKAPQTELDAHEANNLNPHGVNKSQVGLGNADNTSDANKPTSTATQAQIDLKENSAEKGVANGYCELDSGGLVPNSRIQIDALVFLGTWDASTNTPTLVDGGTGKDGEFYIVDVAGTTLLDGISDWAVGDWVISDGLVWDKIPNTQDVSSVFARQGAVVANAGDYNADQITETGANKIMTSAERSAIVVNSAHVIADGKSHSDVVANTAHASTVVGNPHAVTKTEVGLGNVDNTSDVDKPISTLTQQALDLKANLSDNLSVFVDVVYSSPQVGEVLYRSGGSWVNQQLIKDDVGLDQVDNTSDLNKPISTLTQSALDAKANDGDFQAHTGNTGIHFTEASIDHANILNSGTNTHAQIDTHIATILNPHGANLEQDTIDFVTQVTPPAHKEGRVWYDNTRNTLSVYNAVSAMTLNVGEETVVPIWNATGLTITNGQVVRVVGAFGGFPTVVLSQADTIANASVTGVATHDIPDGTRGYITTIGTVGGLDTSGLIAGSLLYLSETIAGNYTQTEQAILHPIAQVLLVDAVDGVIGVRPRGIINITAVGQVRGATHTQSISATPAKCYAFNLGEFVLNTDVNQTINPAVGDNGYDAEISPASIGSSGYFRFTFSVSLSGTANALHTFELYRNGVGTGALSEVDLSNNATDRGNMSISGLTETILLDTDILEIYVYTDVGASDVVYTSALMSIERIGNV